MDHIDELAIRGTRNGLVINLPDTGDLEDLLRQLKARLQATASFFRGGRVALQVGQRDLSKEDLEMIGVLLDEQGVSLWSVSGPSEITQRAAIEWGLETDPLGSAPAPSREDRQPLFEVSDEAGPAVLIRRTLRSGQRIEHPGDVTIVGDVNPGAEIIAGGSVVVWGKLRGTVHAGAAGDESVIVCALSLFPTQLRIGNRIARSPEGRPPQIKVPEIASVQDEEIVAEPWSGS
jgi:septum site-determining protein MinC